MSTQLLAALGISLLATLVLEVGFFWLMGKRHLGDLRLLVLVNVLTNPIVVLLYWWAHPYMGRSPTLGLELFAIVVEGCYYRKYGRDFKRPFLFSAAANVFSFGLGALFQRFF
ncbi:MAG: hypothetical protein FWC28_03340 [Proteobacteria bacterium]|nr:hypothetical protein [Cystobacterineae bacterium]MCL2259302.1 hypothetical protein [Cystobacterineae bacterium]MCL2314273.1 hypothetical protein [Pseudomonadota bacterium]